MRSVVLLALVACAAAMTSGEACAELQLPRRYSEKQLKSAYRKRSLETHPDKGGSTAQFLRVSEAYELLSSASGGGGSGGGSATRGGGSAQGRTRPSSSSFSSSSSSSFFFSSSFQEEGVSQEEMMRRAEEMFDTVFEELMQSLDGGGIEEIVDTMLGPAKVSTSTRTRASTSK
jgi:curved DNA-binding protein CbpA